MKALAVILFLLFIAISGCKENSESTDGEEQQISEKQPAEKKSPLKEFESEDFQIRFDYPGNFEVKEDTLPAKTPVINVYKSADTAAAPFGIHEDPKMGYLAFLPRGFGVEGPAGKQKSIEEFGNSLPLDFEINQEDSKVYLLENGEAWGYFLRFHTPPETWEKHGAIFIRYPVNNFEAECFSAQGDQKSLDQCDPLGGDKVSYFGSVDENFREEINEVLESLYFFRESTPRQELSDLIKVENPPGGSTVESPLEITGEARGNWFFEADAGVELLDGNYRKLSESYIKVDGATWMTRDFVPFKGQLEFKDPETDNGFLVFKKANASGKPEMDRILRIPVKFK